MNVYNTGITHANPPVVFKTNRHIFSANYRRVVGVDLHTSYLIVILHIGYLRGYISLGVVRISAPTLHRC